MTIPTYDIMRSIEARASRYEFNDAPCKVSVGYNGVSIDIAGNKTEYKYDALDTDGHTVWFPNGTLRAFKGAGSKTIDIGEIVFLNVEE